MKKIYQFEIWQINFSPTKGSEQKGLRPALIIETNATDNQGNTTIVIPFTSQLNKIQSLDIIIEPNKKNGLSNKSKLKLRQIRVVDKTRLNKKLGKISDKNLQTQILDILKMLFDFERLFS